MTVDSGKAAEVVRLPVRASSGRDPLPVDTPDTEPEPYDTSFEVVLDDERTKAPPVPVDRKSKEPTKRPIVPEHLRTWSGVRSASVRKAKLGGHIIGYHGVRSPGYFFIAIFWGAVGLFKGIGRQIRWGWATELTAGWTEVKGGDERVKLNQEIAKTRRTRGRWLLALYTLAVICILLMVLLVPWWVTLISVIIGLLLLARLGRGHGKPIVGTAVVQPRYRAINSDIVLAAYYAAGLGAPDKTDPKTGQAILKPDAADLKIQFETILARNSQDTGSQVKVILPRGKTFSDAAANRERLASAIDVALSQVYLTKDKTSNRRHWLLVLDEDPLGVPAGRTPLLDCKPRDVWQRMPLGLDEHGQRVLFCLIFQSILIGAQPRRGKTFTLRLFLLFCALDPYVRLSVFDGAGKPDLRSFALVCHTFGFGLLPNKVQGDPVQNLLATLRAAKKEIQDRNIRLSELPTSVCPEGKLTRDIARNKKYNMPVWVIGMDEFQEYLKTGDEMVDQEIAELLVYMVRVGPSAGVIPLSSTQRPAGLGSGVKVKQAFADYRDNHLIRFALKTGGTKVSDYVLGEGVHSEGFDSSNLPVGDEYRGIGILYDAPIEPCTVRCFLADGEDAEQILIAARKLRERAGTLDGMAAGETIAVQPRDPLTDVLDMFFPDETWVSWNRLSERLAEQLPEQYAQGSARALSSTLIDMKLGIVSRDGRCDSVPGGVAKGVHRAALERAVERRDREAEGT